MKQVVPLNGQRARFYRGPVCMFWLANISLIGLPVSAVWDGDPLNHICL